MTATAVQNRIAPMYYDTPPRTLPELPKTPAERRQVMADAVFASVLALQGLLTDRDPHVVMKAAGMIFDLDKTQMRHSRSVCGTDDPCPLGPISTPADWGNPPASAPPASTERERPTPLFPTPEKMARMSRMADTDDEFEEFDDDEFEDNPFDNAPPEPKTANVADPSVAFVERMRKALQRIADREGTGEVVTWGKAEKAARYAIELRKRINAEAARPSGEPKPTSSRPDFDCSG